MTEVRIQDWESSRNRLGRRLAGVVGMHRPRPVRGLAGLVEEKREAYSRQPVAARVRSGREPCAYRCVTGATYWYATKAK